MSEFHTYLHLVKVFQSFLHAHSLTVQGIAKQYRISLPFLKKLEEPQSPITTFDLKSMDRLAKAFQDHGENLFGLWGEENAFYENIGKQVSRLRGKKGVRIEEVSAATGIPCEVLEDLESGEFYSTEARLNDFNALAAYYGVEFHFSTEQHANPET